MASPQKKLCPFLKDDIHFALECLEEQCAVYLKLQKPAFITASIVDPKAFYKYEGCGLIREISWTLVEREANKPKTAEETQAEEAYKKLDEAKP